MPSHTTFAAGFEGRCHSAIHATNYGLAESLARLCNGAGCGIALGSSVTKALQAEQLMYRQKKLYNKSEKKHSSKGPKKDSACSICMNNYKITANMRKECC